MDEVAVRMALAGTLTTLLAEETGSATAKPHTVVTTCSMDLMRSALEGLALAAESYVFFAEDHGIEYLDTPIARLEDDGSFPGLRAAIGAADPTLLVAASAGRSSAQREFAGLVYLLASDALRSYLRVVVVMSTESLDDSHADLAWSMVQTVGARLDTELIVILSGPVTSDRYLARSERAEYVIDGLNVRRVPGTGEFDVHFAQLPLQGDEPIAFLLGAGFSISSGLPLGNAMRDHALMEYFGRPRPSPELADDFYDYLVEHDAFLDLEKHGHRNPTRQDFTTGLTLERVMLEGKRGGNPMAGTWEWLRQVHDSAMPGPAVQSLGRLIASGKWNGKLVVLTVNFDELLEPLCVDKLMPVGSRDELKEAGSLIEQYLNGSVDRIPYIKLHGTISRPEDIVSDYERLLAGVPRGVEELFDIIGAYDDPMPFIYVGHSMRDLDLQEVLSSPRHASALFERWISPRADPNVERFIARHRIGKWHDDAWRRFVFTTADAYFQLLEERVLS